MTASFLKRPGKPDLAYVYAPPSPAGADLPHVMFCGGYRSDMEGTKALFLEAQCRARGQGFVRFDYRGHGLSGGVFEDCTIGDWLEDTLAVFDHIGAHSTVVIGSSMGGWMALLLAGHRREALAGVLGIAAAPDFTEDMIARLDPAQRAALERDGFLKVPNDYSDEPYHYSLRLYEEAKAHLLLDTPQEAPCPIRLVHGKQDVDVPSSWALRIREAYGESVAITWIEDGDHRLSRPQDLEILDREVRMLSAL